MDFAKVLVTIWYWKNVYLAEQLTGSYQQFYGL